MTRDICAAWASSILETGERLVFPTNNFALSALTITALYKQRWRVELFFKWIKQHLRIRLFHGASENAVKTQIWTALCVHVLAAVVKKELALDVSPHTFLRILSVHSFEKLQLSPAFQGVDDGNRDPPTANQLNLFDSQPDSSDRGYQRPQRMMMSRST